MGQLALRILVPSPAGQGHDRERQHRADQAIAPGDRDRGADEAAERIAALGTSPKGTPGAIINDRTWDDYSVNRDTVQAHLAALDLVYTGVFEDTRKSIEQLEELDLVSQDMLIAHAGELEKFQWFARAHLENSGGELVNEGTSTEKSAASKAKNS